MAITLVGDANIQGHVARLITLMQLPPWDFFWDGLQIRHASFADLGLKSKDVDALVWQRCQEHRACLVTNNRNKRGADSLEATLQRSSTSKSLPVFTISDPDRILTDHGYADRVIDRLLRYLLELEDYLGTGRLYLP